jgi:hypothetical protein
LSKPGSGSTLESNNKALQEILKGFFMPKIMVTRLGVEPRTY